MDDLFQLLIIGVTVVAFIVNAVMNVIKEAKKAQEAEARKRASQKRMQGQLRPLVIL